MTERPPSGVRLHCVEDGFDSTTWTDAWNHRIDAHADVGTGEVIEPNWQLLPPLPEE